MTKPQLWGRWECPHCHTAITTHVNLTEPPGHRCERRDDQHRLRGWVEFQRKANA